MRQWIHAAITNRKITLFILMLLIMTGAFSFYESPRQEYPEINAPVAMITVIYPGASPADVEERVTTKVVSTLEEIEGYDYAYTYSYNSVSVTFLRLVYGTDVDAAWQDLEDKMDDLQPELPPECQAIQTNTDLVETAGLMVTLTGENYSYNELNDVAIQLKDALKGIQGVKRFEILGKQEREIVVEADYRKLNDLGISMRELYGLLQAQNVEIPSGQIEAQGAKVNLRTSGRLKNQEEIRNLVVGVSPQTGQTVFLREIAEVSFRDADTAYKILQDGKNAILLTGYFQKNKNVVLAGEEVNAVIDSFKASMPEDLVIESVLDQPENVRQSVNTFMVNLLQGVAFVLIVVLLGMGLKNALIVSTAIPASIMISFIFMGFFGIELHQISIAALIVALGMLVDNAIVIIDAIQVRLDEGLEREEACISGAREVAVPVLTSTLTTIGAFLPFMLLPSIAGEYIASLPSIIMISLSVSYLVAILVIPSLAYMFLGPSRKKSGGKGVIRLFFERALLAAFRFRALTLVLVLATLGFTVYAALSLNLKFFPYADTDRIYIDLRSENVSSIEITEALVQDVHKVLSQDPLILSETTAVGGGLPKFYNTLPIVPNSNDKAQMMLRIDMAALEAKESGADLEAYAAALQHELDQVLTGGQVSVKLLEQAEPIGAPVQLRLLGNDLDQLGEASERLQQLISKVEGTEKTDTDFENRVFEYVVRPDLVLAGSSGLTQYDLQSEISLALRGQAATTIRLEDGDYDVRLKSNISSVDELRSFGIKSSASELKIPLGAVADVALASEYAVIKSYKGNLATVVMTDIAPGYNAVDIQREIVSLIDPVDYPGIQFKFDGENEKIVENFGNIGSSAVLAVMLVYSVLLFQFRSFTQPLLILLTIPLSAIGSFLGLYFLGFDLSFVAMLGIVSLLGIVVNNAIVLIDFINTERAEGKSVKISCIDAVEKRFRPIMLTTITTVIGLVPLALSGSALFVPMSVALMSGLMVSTLLTLIIIPMVYLWTHRDAVPTPVEEKPVNEAP
ncbi:efflux RND transporter permease subunit [Acidaminobacter hydrogenoformans]|uniref:Multidrug efflux pump subunit AcrB n=1 Tax=Acidaminobacter hydrogenoformans DSM 2784 TaxID=1120920 RepID=A0A1G5RSL9_9FIRM|nr:efflux RND transporter permease subunit [Acidaminobacter hydrogenoformans]SCZ77082.1 Multidrug efflux pump subunit AcrB [Acidaminobacter hydrogenoformans DSM 2784]